MTMTTTSFDTETRGLGWYNADERAFLTTWSDQRGNDHLAHQDDARAMAAFQSDMRKADVIAAHNMPFDVHQTRESENGFDLLTLGKRLVDTALLARVVVPERRFAEGNEGTPYGLDGLSKTYLPAEDQKISPADRAKELGIKLKTTGGHRALWQADPEFLETYAKQDTRATIELLPHLARLVPPTQRIWELERDAMPHLIRAEARGVMVDQAKVTPLWTKYTVKREAAYEAVVAALGTDALGDPDDPDSKDEPAALREALLAYGVPLHRMTRSGEELAVNQPALTEFKNDFPVISALFAYRQASKFLSTYINPMLGRDVVHTSYNQIGAWTGRMSSRNPNLQNLPVRGEGASELREMFVPRPGHCFVVSDFDQIELRLLAYYLNNPGFIERIEAGAQVFQELAATIWGGTPEAYAKGTAGEKKRAEAKNGTYAICYGVGAAKFSDMLDLPPGPPNGPNAWKVQRGYAKATDPSYPEGVRIIKTVKSWLPGYDGLMCSWKGREGRIIQKIRATGHVNTIMGRRQPVDRDKEYVGLSALIQGSAADIFKQAVINVAEATAHLGALPVMFVHDEIVSECPIEHAAEALRLQDAAMAAAYDLRPRLSVSGTIAMNNYAGGKG